MDKPEQGRKRKPAYGFEVQKKARANLCKALCDGSINTTAFSVFVWLLDNMDAGTGTTERRISAVCNALGMSRSTTLRSLGSLQAAGLLRISQQLRPGCRALDQSLYDLKPAMGDDAPSVRSDTTPSAKSETTPGINNDTPYQVDPYQAPSYQDEKKAGCTGGIENHGLKSGAASFPDSKAPEPPSSDSWQPSPATTAIYRKRWPHADVRWQAERYRLNRQQQNEPCSDAGFLHFWKPEDQLRPAGKPAHKPARPTV